MAVDKNIIIIFVGLLGLAVGSFLNVLIIRTHDQTSPWRGRSRCPHCGHTLKWFELIPLVSFVWLLGRCRRCKKTINWQYPAVEFLTAAMFISLTIHFGATWLGLASFIVGSLMLTIAVYDLRWSMLPDIFSIVLSLSGLIVAWLMKLPWPDILFGLFGGLTFFGLQYILSRRRWVCSGDILLGGALGMLLGWRLLALGLLLAYLSGAIAAIILLIIQQRKTSSAIAFGPFLIIGGYLAWLWGPQMIDWYFNHAIFH